MNNFLRVALYSRVRMAVGQNADGQELELEGYAKNRGPEFTGTKIGGLKGAD
jgi:hypothetical protein